MPWKCEIPTLMNNDNGVHGCDFPVLEEREYVAENIDQRRVSVTSFLSVITGPEHC
jgi:hypothetical protein